MNFRQTILNLLPEQLILAVTDLRCLWRCNYYTRQFPSRAINLETVLIVAPHPDDETFGCGGMIKLKRDAGVSVRVVLLTDGEAVGGLTRESSEVVVTSRRREFIEASHRLGLKPDDLRWLHLPDGKLPHPGDEGFEIAVKALLGEIQVFTPGEIYCTHWQDARQDHIAAAHLTQAALEFYSEPCTLAFYPIWMWYHASSGLRKRVNFQGVWSLDISSVHSTKKHAMAAYLEAPKTISGNPYCGRLPWSFLQNFQRRVEVYFPALPNIQRQTPDV
jgi:LmbE family N-acetylglucosaminyl deacetylase